MGVKIGEKAPNFGVSDWVQGAPTNFDQEKDHIVLLEVFQVNCPGCFMGAIPDAIKIYEKYKDEGVRVLGLATAFEDFDKNNLDKCKYNIIIKLFLNYEKLNTVLSKIILCLLLMSY